MALTRLDAIYKLPAIPGPPRFADWEPGARYKLTIPLPLLTAFSRLDANATLLLFQGDALTHALCVEDTSVAFSPRGDSLQHARVRVLWRSADDLPHLQWPALFPNLRRPRVDQLTPIERTAPYKDHWAAEGGLPALLKHLNDALYQA